MIANLLCLSNRNYSEVIVVDVNTTSVDIWSLIEGQKNMWWQLQSIYFGAKHFLFLTHEILLLSFM